MKLGTWAFLYAVHRPPHLRQPLQFTQRTHLCVGVYRKATVIGRMPVLAGDYRFAPRVAGLYCPIGYGDHGIAVCHRQCAAGAKIVLQID
ncbi:hypothetical protein D3C72_1007610 [compost metagenome]